jgi:glycine/D-amino acid oxidase-like deaminating enzyme
MHRLLAAATKYDKSVWIDQFPKSRLPAYPRHKGTAPADVVIIGGGLTGCATAYAFAAAGVKVVLLEAGQIGRGNTGAAGGWIADEPGLAFTDLEKTIGARDARRAWQSWRRASLDFAALLRRLSVKCQLEARPALTVATTPEQLARLTREHKARRSAGIDAPLLTSRAATEEAGFHAVAGLRAKDSAIVDPYRACLGLAAAAAARGATLFEQSPVTKITFNRKIVDIFTAGGSIRANRVVVATGMPTAIFKSLIRHFWFRSTYFALTAPVPAKIRQQLGRRAAVLRDCAQPPHAIRWMDDRLLVSGADSETPPLRLREKAAVQRTGQLMYELSTLYPDISGLPPQYGWAADYALTGNGLPSIGPHRNYPHHLFAFGDASHSLTGAYLASRVLLRHHFEEMDPADAVFGFHR